VERTYDVALGLSVTLVVAFVVLALLEPLGLLRCLAPAAR
jgi:hypothetical protein